MSGKVTGAQITQMTLKTEDFRQAVNYVNPKNKGYVRFEPDGKGGVKLAKINNKIDLFLSFRSNIDAEKNKAMRDKFVTAISRDLKWADQTKVSDIAASIKEYTEGAKKGQARTDVVSRKELQAAFKDYDRLMNTTAGRQEMIDNLLKNTAERCGIVASEDAVKELKHRFFASNEDWKTLHDMCDCNPDIDVGQPGHMKMDELAFKAKLHTLELKCEDAVKRATIENAIKMQAETFIGANALGNDFGLRMSEEEKGHLRSALHYFLQAKGLDPEAEVRGKIGTGGLIFNTFIDKVLPELFKKGVNDVREAGEDADKKLAIEANFTFDAIMDEAEKFMIEARDYINNPPLQGFKSTGDAKMDGILAGTQQTVHLARNMAKMGHIQTAEEELLKTTNIGKADADGIRKQMAGNVGAFEWDGVLRTFTQKFLAERGIGEGVKAGKDGDAIFTNTIQSIVDTTVKLRIAAKLEYGSAKNDIAANKRESLDDGMGAYVKDMEDAIGEIASGKDGKDALDQELIGKLFTCTLANIANRKVNLAAAGASTNLNLDKASEEEDRKLLEATAKAYVSFEKNVLKTINGAKTAFEKIARTALKKGLLTEQMFNRFLERASSKFANAHKAALHEFFLKSPVVDAAEGEKLLKRLFRAALADARAELDNDLVVASIGRTIGAHNQLKLLAVEERVKEALAQPGLDDVKLGRPGIIDEKTARARLAAGALKRLYTKTLAAHLKSIKKVDGVKTLTDKNVADVIKDFNSKASDLLKAVAKNVTAFFDESERLVKNTIKNNLESEAGAFKSYFTGEYPITGKEEETLIDDMAAETMRFRRDGMRAGVEEILDSPTSFEKTLLGNRKDAKTLAKATIDNFKVGGADNTIYGLLTVIEDRNKMIEDFLANKESMKNAEVRFTTQGEFDKGGALADAGVLEKQILVDAAMKGVKARMKALPLVYATGDKAALEKRMVDEAVKGSKILLKDWTAFRKDFLAKVGEIEAKYSAMGAEKIANCRNWVLSELCGKCIAKGVKSLDMTTAIGYFSSQLEDNLKYEVGKAKERFDAYVARVDKVLRPVMDKVRQRVEATFERNFGSLSAEGQAHLRNVVLPKLYKGIEFAIYCDPVKFQAVEIEDLRTGKKTDGLDLVVDDIMRETFHPLTEIVKANRIDDNAGMRNLVRIAGAGVLLNDAIEAKAAFDDVKAWLAKDGHAKQVEAEKALLDYYADAGAGEYDENNALDYGAMAPGNAVAGFRFAVRDILSMHTAQMLYSAFDNTRVGEAKDAFERWVDSHGLSKFTDYSKTTVKERIMEAFNKRVADLQKAALESAVNEPILTPAFIELIDHIIDSDGVAAMVGEWKTNALQALKDRYLKTNDEIGYVFDKSHPRSVAAGAKAQATAEKNREMILSLLSSRISDIAGKLDSAGSLDAVRKAIAKVDMNAIIAAVNTDVNTFVEKCVRRFEVDEQGDKLYGTYSHSIERQLIKDTVGDELAAFFPNGFSDLLANTSFGKNQEAVEAVGTIKKAIAEHLDEALKYCHDQDLAPQSVKTMYENYSRACLNAVKKDKVWTGKLFKDGLADFLKKAAKELQDAAKANEVK